MRAGRSFDVLAGIGTIFAGLSLSGMLWLVAEGVQVFIDIEENTRQTAYGVATPVTVPPAQLDTGEILASLAAVVRLLEQVAAYQQQTNQRLDSVTKELNELHANVGSGVKAMEAVAESSKVTATVLYRQVSKHN